MRRPSIISPSTSFGIGRIESLPQRRDHLAEPEKVEGAQYGIGYNKRNSQPGRHRIFTRCGIGSPYIPIHAYRLVGAPNQAAATKAQQEQNAVDKLSRGSGHAGLVEEPVDIQEGCRELVEDQIHAVVIHERPLELVSRCP